jgi:hypothetical protein
MFSHKFFIDFTVYITVFSSFLFLVSTRLNVGKVARFLLYIIRIPIQGRLGAVEDFICFFVFRIKYVITIPLLYLAVYFYQQDVVDHPLIKSIFNFKKSIKN